MSQLDNALREFGAAEANLAKLERLWNLLQKNTPSDIVFGANPVYEDACRSYKQLLVELPLIDGWKPMALPWDLPEIAQSRLNAREIGEIHIQIEIEGEIEKGGKELRKYRFYFDQKRRKLIHNIVCETINEIEQLLDKLQKTYPLDDETVGIVESRAVIVKIQEPADWQLLSDKIQKIDVLLGSSVPRPSRWGDMNRHLYYGEIGDFRDIITSDWPSVKEGLLTPRYAENEPIPVGVTDLSELILSNTSGSVLTQLNWKNLSAEDFERLIFILITSDQNYENPQWLMHTNAPDRGRDLSVYRVNRDRFSGVIRRRAIIQCKHWLSKSISLPDISTTKDQVKLWEPPRVDSLIIATTGRFTADAVNYTERHNQSDSAMTIELWPESHLETILASTPALVAEFGLR
jgi:Restriction endonuclease